MLHTDVPTRREIAVLASMTAPWSVSIYTPTEVDPAEPDVSRVAFSNQVRDALERVTAAGERAALSEEFDDLLDDPEFWRYQSRTLVVLATPERIRIYRLPNRLPASTTVADRFLLKPLLRTVTFPQSAYVLALSEGAARLVHVDAEGPAVDITPRDLPNSASDHAKKASLGDRAPKGRVQGYEGRKMRVRQYARAVDQQLRTMLTGRDVPLVLAATEPTDSLFRSVNSYPDLLDESLAGNPEHLGPDELAAQTRPILDCYYAGQLSDLRTLFDKRMSEGRALADIADIARAATFGIVGTLFVDIETAIPGTLATDDGAVEFGSDAEGLDVLDEIARRVLLTDGRVLAVRGPEVPGGGPAAAILRYPM
ncbi:baeRF11 domain-containing protein [Nocardia sp. NPDC055029]